MSNEYPLLPDNEPATAGFSCPIEKLPVGTEVAIRVYDGCYYRKVGTPVYVKGEYISGRYRDCIREWDYVSRGTLFSVSHVPSGKPVPTAWAKAAAEGI